MNAHTIREKILKEEISDKDLAEMLGQNTHSSRKGGFFKTLIKGFIDVYTTPNIYRTIAETLLIILIIAGIVILSLTGHIDSVISSVLFAFILGFLFGKIK
jgi:hypothetical protein